MLRRLFIVFIGMLILHGNVFANEIDDEDFQREGYTCYGYPYNVCQSNDDFDPVTYHNYPYPIYIHNGYGNSFYLRNRDSIQDHL